MPDNIPSTPRRDEDALLRLLVGSPLFDPYWYGSKYDVAGGAAAALSDYLSAGRAFERDPHALFDTEWYVSQCAGLIASGESPLLHYLREGAREGRSPHPLFDPAFYRHQRPEHSATYANPLLDYLCDEGNWDTAPHPLFDGGRYRQLNPDVVAGRINPLQHFLQSGASEGRSPHPLFQCRWYLERYPEVARSGINPLRDYVMQGALHGRNPNRLFDSRWYLKTYPDVADAGINPLVHYVQSGWLERRNPTPLFDVSWYQARYPEVNKSGIDPFEHYLTRGLQAGYLGRSVDRITHDCNALDIPFEIWRAPDDVTGREVCLAVTYAADGRIEDHVVTMLRALHAAGLTIVLVVVTEGMNQPLRNEIDFVEGVLVRINHGWDFAAWGTALAAFPDLWEAQLVLLVNDSIYGPTEQDALEGVLTSIRMSKSDIVALTDSHQVQYHLMSYFTALKRSALEHSEVRSFWNQIRSNRDKGTVIKEYEMRSAQRWENAGVSYEVLFPTAPPAGERAINPTLDDWRGLVERGFPFIKVQALRDAAQHGWDIEGWESVFRDSDQINEIKTHLDRPHARQVNWRPVPSPKQRFLLPEELATYYGATTAFRPTEEVDLALEVPFRFRPLDDVLPERVAVVVHIFYPELCPVLLAHIRHIPVSADLLISTNTEEKRVEIAAAFAEYDAGRVEIQVFPNVGRDLAPVVVGFRDALSSYEYFVHIHSKKSPHEGSLVNWRPFLLGNILGSKQIVRSILHLLVTENVGMVFSQHFAAVRHLLNFGYNYDAMKSLLGRCGIELTRSLVLEFPSGSFFWARTAALKPLFDLNLDWSDFPDEQGQVDGTIAHAIERSLLYVVETSGHRWVKVADARNVPVEGLVPVLAEQDVAPSLARTHRPLLHNLVRSPKDIRFISEINPILARADYSARPRLNLFVPTLQPAKVFGGIATALRFFRELGSRLGPDGDLRIISVSEPVNLSSMLRFPGYRLMQQSSVVDDYPKVVLDASERQRGYCSVRSNDVFIATAWWTAASMAGLREFQSAVFGRKCPLVYLIQDHEPNFYAWSSNFVEAQRTYAHPEDMIAVLNSEEFGEYFRQRYALDRAFVLPFSINPSIESAITELPRERIILVYGRPSVERNCFALICKALLAWQRANPTTAQHWRIVSAGESFDAGTVSQIRNLEVQGKLSLSDYGNLLSRASIGISLMTSPHPSYPPLEMASAGMRTITNSFGGKDLSNRSPNIISVAEMNADLIARELDRAVRAAEALIGKVIPPTPTSASASSLPIYDPDALMAELAASWQEHT